MLKVVQSIGQLNFSAMMNIYIEGNLENGKMNYPDDPEPQQLLKAEQDFYHYLDSVFFQQKDSWYAIWKAEGRDVSALRIEPYQDGYLMCALETAPSDRRRGYATALLISVQNYLSRQGSGILYSHVSKKNTASLSTHQKCGFQIIKEHAVYSDGSVLMNHFTLAYSYKKSET